jgi:hypothetical protein
METTKHKLSPHNQAFFDNLSNYINIKLLYYGSIQRPDYIPGYSDIDVLIFTENEYTTIAQMQHFLKAKNSKFKKFVSKLGDKFVYGYKIAHKDPENNLAAEFSIHNEKFRDEVIYEHTLKSKLNGVASFMLTLLKIFHYYFNIIGPANYKYYKHWLISYGTNTTYDETFLVV